MRQTVIRHPTAAPEQRTMNISGRVQSCCITLFLTLTSVSALQTLNSINDLKKVNFGQTVPKHSLLLLHWFANVIDIDNNNVIRLTFDPNDGNYGSHHYGNFERVLDPLPPGRQYFTVGNLNQGTSQLPHYVLHPPSEYTGRNMDRIIFRVQQQNAGRQALQRIDQVYITQHYQASEQQGTRYDPDNTYRVTTNLLRQIREFSVGEDQQSLSELRNRFGSNNSDDFQLRHIKQIWHDLACLGLFLFIVIQEKYSYKQPNKKPERSARRNPQPDFVVNIPENRPNRRDDNNYNTSIYSIYLQEERDDIHLEVTTGIKGRARIRWGNIPRHRLKDGVMVVLFKNNSDQEASGTYRCVGNKESGSYDTSVPLNEGLQVRLHKVRRKCCFWKVTGEEICRGPEFENSKADETVNIAGYNAKLQLFVRDGKACARLFIKKTFHEWRSEFKNSWVGFYASANKGKDQYEWWQWQWATKFKLSTDVSAPSHDVYDYHSGLTIASGVQARFILSGEVAASTPSWR